MKASTQEIEATRLLYENINKSTININGIKKAISKGANLNAPILEGSFLHLAVNKADFFATKLLIDHGADINCTDLNFETAIDIASRNKSKDILGYLLKKRALFPRQKIEDAIEFYCEFHQVGAEASYKEKNNDLLDYTVSKLVGINIQTLLQRKGYLQRLVYLVHLLSIEKGEKEGTRLEGWNAEEFFPLRIMAFFEILIDLILSSKKISPLTVEGLKDEILCELETLRTRRDFLAIGKDHFSESEKAKLRKDLAYGIAERFKKLPTGKSYTIHAGWEEHTIYIDFSRQNHKLIIRIDNLGEGSNAKHARTNSYLHPSDPYQKDHIYSCLIGEINAEDLDPDKGNLKYLEAILEARNAPSPRTDNYVSFDKIYNSGKQPFIKISKPLSAIDLGLPSMKSQQAGNCVVYSHQIGLSIRLGQQAFKWLCYKELEKVAPLAPPDINKPEKFSLDENKIKELWEKEKLPRRVHANLTDALRIYYREQAYFNLSADQNTKYFLGRHFIHPVIVQRKEHRTAESQLDTPTKVRSDQSRDTWQNLHTAKDPISIKSIFDKYTSPGRRLIIFGKAGSGKSTVAKYIAYACSNEGLWSNHFELVFLISLKHLVIKYVEKKEPYTIIEIIENECFCMLNRQLSAQEKKNIEERLKNQRVLLILDGYDEIANSIPSYLQSLLEELLKYPNRILTSRPTAIFNEADSLSLEVIGFTDKNITEYINLLFKPENERIKIKKFLTENPSVWRSAHIPIILELTCSILQNQLFIGMPATITKVYYELIGWLLKNYLKKHLGIVKNYQPSDFYRHPFGHLIIDYIGHLALFGLQQGKYVTDYQIIRNTSNLFSTETDLLSEILNFDLIKPITDIDNQTKYYFIHVTFQEFLTAFCLVNYLKKGLEIPICDDQKISYMSVPAFVEKYKFNSLFENTWRFVAGLLESNPKELNLFFQLLLDQPEDLSGVYSNALYVRCLDEIKLNNNLLHKDKILASIANQLLRELGYGFRHSWRSSYFLQTLTTNYWVLADSIIQKVLLSALINKNQEVRLRAIHLLAEIKKVDDQIISILFELLTDSTLDNSTFGSILYAIDSLAQEKPVRLTKQVITIFNNKDFKFKIEIIKRLRNIGLALLNQNIDDLSKALKHSDSLVKTAGMQLISELESIPKSLLEELILVLNSDDDWSIKLEIAEILFEFPDLHTNIISTLIPALNNHDQQIKKKAAIQLVTLNLINPKVVDALFSTLNDQDEDYDEEYINAFVETAHHYPDKIIPNLIKNLVEEKKQDNVDAVNYSAHVLAKLIPKHVNLILPKFIELLVTGSNTAKLAIFTALEQQTTLNELAEILIESQTLITILVATVWSYNDDDDIPVSAGDLIGKLAIMFPEKLVDELFDMSDRHAIKSVRRRANTCLGITIGKNYNQYLKSLSFSDHIENVLFISHFDLPEEYLIKKDWDTASYSGWILSSTEAETILKAYFTTKSERLLAVFLDKLFNSNQAIYIMANKIYFSEKGKSYEIELQNFDNDELQKFIEHIKNAFLKELPENKTLFDTTTRDTLSSKNDVISVPVEKETINKDSKITILSPTVHLKEETEENTQIGILKQPDLGTSPWAQKGAQIFQPASSEDTQLQTAIHASLKHARKDEVKQSIQKVEIKSIGDEFDDLLVHDNDEFEQEPSSGEEPMQKLLEESIQNGLRDNLNRSTAEFKDDEMDTYLDNEDALNACEFDDENFKKEGNLGPST